MTFYPRFTIKLWQHFQIRPLYISKDLFPNKNKVLRAALDYCVSFQLHRVPGGDLSYPLILLNPCYICFYSTHKGFGKSMRMLKFKRQTRISKIFQSISSTMAIHGSPVSYQSLWEYRGIITGGTQ